MSLASLLLGQAKDQGASLARKLGTQIGLLEPPLPELPYGAALPKHVFRWDLDKTYLRTEFDSARDLLKSAIETAADKQAYPGAPALLRALQQDGHRICIVSGSPTQMRQVLAAKLALDGVAYDEFVLKNNLKNLLRGRFRSLRAQIPYKLPAMLASRASIAAPAETLFGDDAEADAIVYCMYADIVNNKVAADEVARVLSAARTYPDDADRIMGLVHAVPRGNVVKRVFIHLDRRSPTLGFRKFGSRLVPVYNYFQTAMVLFGDGVLSTRQLLFVALEMLESKQYEIGTLATSMQDLVRRGRLPREVTERMLVELRRAATEASAARRPDLPPIERIIDEFETRLRELAGANLPIIADVELDYVRLVDEEHAQRKQRRKHGM